MTTRLCSRTTSLSAAVEGPGMDSAVAKRAWSSRWQKYCARKSSGRQMSFAPASAASRTRATALSRFAWVSGEQDIWMRATRVVLAGILPSLRQVDDVAVVTESIAVLLAVGNAQFAIPEFGVGRNDIASDFHHAS